MFQKQLERPEAVDVRPTNNDSRQQKRGIAWVLGSFLFCPCHLPLTLGLLAAIFSGTALGGVVLHYSLFAGAIVTLIWAAGTWYGFRQLRARQTCAIPLRNVRASD